MDLTQLANLGEFIGGVAVLVTLIYLTLQLRQANALALAEAQQNSNEAFSRWRQMIAAEGLNEIWLKALDEDDLSPQEAQRLYLAICELAYAAIATTENQVAVGNRDYATRAHRAVAGELQSASMRVIWKRVASNLQAYGFNDFASVVTGLVESEEMRG